MIVRLLMALLLLRCACLPAADQNLVVGYLPEYRLETITPAQLVGVTDLIFFSIAPTKEGRLPNPPIAPTLLAKYREATASFKGRRLITVGGWSRSLGFPMLTTNRVARGAFIEPLLKFCRANGFQGIDYDWEHPNDLEQLHNYAALLADTKALAGSDGFLVTVAQAGWQILPKKAYAIVDRVHLMAYDHNFPQATMKETMRETEELVGRWCPPHKAVIGVPFYGRNKKGEALAYAEIIRRFPTELSKDIAGGYAYNNRSMMLGKIDYIKRRKLGGIMIWELGQDSVGKDALLPTIIRQMRPLSR